MPRPGRTDLNRLQLLDPARDVRSDPSRTQRAFDTVHRRISSETGGSEPIPDIAATASPIHLKALGRVRRVRVGLAAATAVVVVGGAVTAVIAASTRTTTQQDVAVPGDLTPYTTTISVEAGSGFHISTVIAASGNQTATIVSSSHPDTMARVTVTSGESAPTPSAGRDPVDLGNGILARWVPPTYGDATGPPQPDLLSWNSAGLTLAAQGSVFGTDSDVIAIAKAVRLDTTVPLKTPVKIPTLPASWQVQALTTTHTDVAGGSSRSALISIAVPGGTRSNGSVPAIDIETRATGRRGDTTTGRPVDIGGRTWRWNTNSDTLTWYGTDRVVSVGPLGSSRPPLVPPATLQTFVAHLTFATSFQDTSTWFDAASAVPS